MDTSPLQSILLNLFSDHDEPYRDGLMLATLTLIATIILEIFSLDTVMNVLKQKNGQKIYMTGIVLNFVNHLGLGGALYPVVAYFSINDKDIPIETWTERIFQITWVVTVHAIIYYYLHKTFHESPSLYIFFHKFHHQFKVYVPPSSANAVTVGEYFAAYMIPFLIAVVPYYVVPIHISSMKIAICFISLTNLLVHTPKLERLSILFLPSVFVSTSCHLQHHQRAQIHYASPTINIDYLVNYTKKYLKKIGKQKT